ncbi:MAG: VOC family protein [Spirochaetales bacterium]|nr:VOC family protein [Spirochaetales bacterium]
MSYVIGGIQQLGVGTPDEQGSCEWYARVFGMTTPIFREAAPAPFMTRYTGGEVQSRSATLAINLQGGSGFEIWQYTSRKTQPAEFEIQTGDLGFLYGKIKANDLEGAFAHMKKEGVEILSEKILPLPDGRGCFYLRDPWNNIFQVIEDNDFFQQGKYTTGGPCGAVIGVSDMEKSLKFYQELLGYDLIIDDETASFEDMAVLPGGSGKFRRVLLSHSQAPQGPFAPVFGTSYIELVQALDREPVKIFKDRFWGDAGFIHLCFDILNMPALQEACNEAGHPFTVDSADSFNMGEAAGHFTYIEDPDGALIEFVETHKIPLLKKLNWYLDLTKRAGKPLPRWMLKMLKSNKY